MVMQPDELSTEALLAHAGWLSALARRLVRDPNEADDVAQDALLAALSSDATPHRSWLAGVARNVARMRARSHSARVEREHARPLPSDSPSAAELAEKLEAQRLLVEAVREHDEPYRTTILLHYWEHKTSAEIAAIEKISDGTVRWRLKHGVDALRARLDARHGGNRNAWSALIAPLAHHTGAGTLVSASLVTGIVGMKLILQAAVAVVVAAAIGSGVWLIERPRALDAGPTVANEHVQAALEPGGARTREAPLLEEPQGTQRTPGIAVSPTTTKAAPAGGARVEARIVDESNQPLAGAHVVVVRTHQTQTSDALGRIAFDVADLAQRANENLSIGAEAHATRLVSAELTPGRTTWLGDVVLRPAGIVSGRIVDAQDHPVAGATVGLDPADVPQMELEAHGAPRDIGEPRVTSAADGTFHIHDAPVRRCRVVALSASHLAGYSSIVEVRAGQESADVEVELPDLTADRMLRGVVLDPDGLPVSEAMVDFEIRTPDTTRGGLFLTDGNGRFERIVEAGSTIDLSAQDVRERWSDALAFDVRPSDKDVVLRFAPARWLDLAVTDAAGKAIEEWQSDFHDPAHMNSRARTSRPEPPGGSARLLLPSSLFVIELTAHGFQDTLLGPFEPAAMQPQLTAVMQRVPVPGISGRVLSAHGPVAGARVRLFANAEGRVEHNGFPVIVDPSARDDVRTGADGTFVLTMDGGGTWFVRVDAEPFAPAERVLTNVDAARGVAGIELTLTNGGAIQGHVLALPDRPPAGTVVAISRGDGFARTQRVGPDGAFAFDHLVPGRWMVSKRNNELDPAMSSTTSSSDATPELPWNCAVVDGRTTTFDLGDEAAPACVLIGKLDVRGAQMGTWNASFAGGQSEDQTVSLDANGSFRLERAQPGDARVLLTAVDGPFAGTRLLAPLFLQIGERRWNQQLDAAKLAVHGAGSASSAPLAFVVAQQDGSFWLRILPDTGDVEVTVPAGKARVLRLDPKVLVGPDPRQWPGGIAIDVDDGATVQLERP